MNMPHRSTRWECLMVFLDNSLPWAVRRRAFRQFITG